MTAQGEADLGGVRVLVTGGAGFIGSHLVAALLKRGARVRVLDNFATGRRRNLPDGADGFELIEGDIRDPSCCVEACAEVRYVLHQAALGSVPRSLEEPLATMAANASGTLHILDAARRAGVRRVVYASSSSVYGNSAALPKREGEEGEPLSPYALSKRSGEEIARTYARCYGLESVGLRYFNVYGPRQPPDGPYAAVIPKMFESRRRGTAPTIFGDGGQTRDFTYVEDAVRANLLALTAAPADGRACNVAGGRQTSILDLDRRIATLTGGGPPAVHVASRPGDVRHSVADLGMAAEMLGYSATVDLETGLRLTRDYYHGVAAPTPSR